MSTVIKYFYKGENTDLIVFAASEQLVNEYLENPSIGKLAFGSGWSLWSLHPTRR